MARQIIPTLLLLVPLLLGLAACRSSTEVVRVQYPAPRAVTLLTAGSERQPAVPLNVSIAVFEPAAPGAVQPSRALAPVRTAETAYLPVQLRDTLSETGLWGQVRVLPAADPASEVSVVASIVASTAVQLVLEVKVVDATGRVWMDRRFEDYATDFDFEATQASELNPYQDMFNDIANDMFLARQQLSASEVENVSQLSTLRYGAALAPEAFGPFIRVLDERWMIEALPARADPMLARVRAIRERDDDMMEVINDHFTLFQTDMQKVYPYWRRYSYELLVYNESLARREGSGRSRSGSWAAVEDVYDVYRELKMNEDELRMMASSFTSEIEPTLMELEGRVVELKGSLSDRVTAWRDLLRRLYQAERGF